MREREREVARAVRTSGGISDLSFCSAQRVLNATACVHSEIAESKATTGGGEVEEGRKRERGRRKAAASGRGSGSSLDSRLGKFIRVSRRTLPATCPLYIRQQQQQQ